MAIRIAVKIEQIGNVDVVRSVSVNGHQRVVDGSHGVLCASVSFLFRTIANSLANTADIDSVVSYSRRGELTIDIRSYSLTMVPTLVAIHNLMLQGVHDLMREYPHEVFLKTVPYRT